MNIEKLTELKSYLSYLQKNKRISSFRIDEKHKVAIANVNSKRELISLMNVLGGIAASFNIAVMDERKNRYRVSIINFDENWKNFSIKF